MDLHPNLKNVALVVSVRVSRLCKSLLYDMLAYLDLPLPDSGMPRHPLLTSHDPYEPRSSSFSHPLRLVWRCAGARF